MAEEEELDPSIFQYDEIYDEMKKDSEPKKERSRSRSKEKKERAKEEPKKSRYIGKMKQLVEDRKRAHEQAYEHKMARDNAKMGVADDMVFVTESYLKKKEEEKAALQKKREQEFLNSKAAVEKGDYLDFKKKMLEQTYRMGKR